MMYCDPSCKPWTSATWAPEGFADRADIVDAGRVAESYRKSPEGVEEGRVEKVEQPQHAAANGHAANGNGYFAEKSAA